MDLPVIAVRMTSHSVIEDKMFLALFFVLHFIVMCFGQPNCGSGLENVAHFSFAIDIGNPRNSTELLEIIPDDSWSKCIQDCKRRSACDFINFHPQTHVCFIIGHVNRSIAAQTELLPGYLYAKKTELDMVEYEGCHVCSPGQSCDNSVNPITCHVTSCGPPNVQDDDVEVAGNVYTPDSSVQLRCTDTQYHQMTSLTCLPDGNWTQTNFTCQPPTTTTTTTTTPAPTYPPLSCHGFTNVYRTFTLEDGTAVRYKVNAATLPAAQARTTCSVEGGYLLRLTTLARMNFVLQLSQCQGFPSGDTWVSGQYDQSKNKWPTWDGTYIPLTNNYWAAGRPDDLDTQHCVRMNPVFMYYLDNKECDQAYQFICETEV